MPAVAVVALIASAGAVTHAPAMKDAAQHRGGHRIGTALAVSRNKPAPAKPSSKPTPAPTSEAPSSPTPDPTSSTPTPDPTTSTPTPDPTSSSGDNSCGPAAPGKADGSPWVCTFDDEFNGTTLDRSKWFVQTTAASGFHSGAECFVDSPNNISIDDGTLNLTVREEDAPFTCANPGASGDYSTQYTSGTVNSLGKFSQTYGRFEVRAKLPATTVKGLQETFWLWPNNPTKYGLWPASGEIDFAEFYSGAAGWNIPYLHYKLEQSTVNWDSNTNVYTALPGPNAQPGMNCRINQAGFNTYTATWQPGQIVLQVNGQNCIVDNYSASNVADPAPFNQPFFIALTQALGIGNNSFVPGTTPLPATTQVDYVRVWS
ncbi:MAG TPA: glycoside hydrolase family 16 protein [Jatrophihabitans sp.]|nr:glycoside hydrolase family 16 protein [Jatrophihabitans sp.]